MVCGWGSNCDGGVFEFEYYNINSEEILLNRGNMSIAALLQAAEYIERRERGK